MSSPIVERLVAEQLAAFRHTLELELSLKLTELRAELERDIAELNARVTTVHTEALRAITRTLEARK